MASYEDYAEYQHAVRIWQVIPPILILLGTLGNVLTIVVMVRRRNRGNSTAMFLCALAISDVLVLYTGLLRQWLKYVSDIDLRQLTTVGCKTHLFSVYLSTQMSSWLLVAVTCERFIGVCFPHIKIKLGCTKKSAIVVIICLVTILALLNSHWFYGFGIYTVGDDNSTYTHKCTTMFDNYDFFVKYTWPWVDLCVFCLIPFSILMVANISIIAKVLVSKHKTRIQVAAANSDRVKKKDEKTSQLTAMLILLNLVFFVCVTPISVYLIGQPYWPQPTAKDVAVRQLWWAIVNILMYMNNTLNFVLYCLSGTRFRAEVIASLCRGQGHTLFSGKTQIDTNTERLAMRSTNSIYPSKRFMNDTSDIVETRIRTISGPQMVPVDT